MGASAIEWTDATWNPVTGCDRVSPGCAHCYALDLAAKFKGWGQARYQRDGGKASGPGFGVTLHPDKLDEPLRWRKPRMVFVNSMSDLFHPEIPDEYIARVFAVMACAPQHTFQVLTKRPERMRDLLIDANGWVTSACEAASEYVHKLGLPDGGGPENYLCTAEQYHAMPALPNVWLGVTIENRRYVHRADVLRDTPAAVRFVSAEPLLGPLVDPTWTGSMAQVAWRDGAVTPALDLTNIDWLIVGGESGSKARPVDPAWVRDLRSEAISCGTAFFFKQWGGWTAKSGGRDLDGRTWDELPVAA